MGATKDDDGRETPERPSTQVRTEAMDLRGVPANACPACGSRVLKIRAVFEDYDIAAWFTDAECAECATLLTAPCPVDRPEGYWTSEPDPYESWAEEEESPDA